MERHGATRYDIAGVIASRLGASSITLRQAAEATGIPLTTLHRKVRGHTQFRMDELDAIAKVLDVPLSDLIAESEAGAA